MDDFIKGEEKDLGIFNLLNSTLNKLNNSLVHSLLIYYYFFWNFVFILGHGPELFKCSACNQKLNPDNLYFSNKDGGTICENCYVSKKYSIEVKSDIIKILRLILKDEWNTLIKLKIEEKNIKLLNEISDSYLKYLLEYRI